MSKVQISFEDFSKLEMKVGKIISAEKHPDPKVTKLLVLQVDVGEALPRQVVAGIGQKFLPEELIGRQLIVVTNLAPVKLRGVESTAMLLAAGGDSGVIDLVSANAEPGTAVR
jgi:methionyl-tRNA synthetase